MPQECKICGKEIPWTVKVDGENKPTGRRLHCFDCVPFGERLKNPERKRKSGEKRICPECRREHQQSGRNLVCSSCKNRRRRDEHRDRAIEYLGGKCNRCGYDKCKAAFDFHHSNPDEKEIEISRHWQRSWDRLKIELDKCELLCANCHREEHSGI